MKGITKILKLAAAAAALGAIAGCSSLDPDIRAVKDTVIEENHSFFTVGRVLDFYPDCSDTDWKAYRDADRHRWVSYACRSKSADEFRENAREMLGKNYKAGDSFREKAERALDYSDASLVIRFRLLGESDKWKVSSAAMQLKWPDGTEHVSSLPVYLVLAAMKKGEKIKPEEINEKPGLLSRAFGRMMKEVELRLLVSAWEKAHQSGEKGNGLWPFLK